MLEHVRLDDEGEIGVMVYALVHFIGGAAALTALIHVMTRQRPRDASRQPMLVVVSLLSLIAAGHVLRGIEFLGLKGLDSLIDYCRVLSPLLWIFLIYAWVRNQDAMKLEASQRKVQAMIDRMPVMVDAFDENRMIALWNHECERVTGYSAAEMVGNSRAMEILYPDAAYREHMLASWRARSGSYRDWRWEITCKDGSKRTIAWSNVSNEVPIEPWVWWGVGVDVTEQALVQALLTESETRFRMFMDQSQAESFIKDEKGRYLFGNRAWARQFGKPVEELLGKTDQELWPPEVARLFMESDETIRRTGGPIHVEEPGPVENGQQTWYDVYKFPVPVESGQMLVGGIVMNITERKRAEQERQRLEAQLVQTQRLEAVGNLAAGIAHDFSNLLTAITGHLALSYRSLPSDHPARKSLLMVEKAAQQGVAMTRSLLTFANKTPSAKQPCSLRDLMHESLQIFRHMLPNGIEVQIESNESDSPWVMASPSQLQQALMNLILNARDAMPDGGTLRLAVHSKAEPGQDGRQKADASDAVPDRRPVAVIEVEDTGVGMSQQTLSRVFEPFFTTKERHKGTGLGLSVVHGIVTDHGGRIEVTSELGRGTRFEITLPACEPGAAPGKAPAHIVPPAGRRRGVLLMHKPDYVREVIMTALEAAGFPVLLSETPAEAIRLFRERGNEAGVVVIDADDHADDVPGSLTNLSHEFEVVPMIVVTANTAQFLDEPGNGNRFLVSKPFQMSQLVEMVNRALGLVRASEL